ncbi:MAG: type I-B CRISPR-associated protein Cas7/Csh2 [Beggiatoa sp. IS2]|nr:MAG: type I-B CRISPR-associated protein Cas7/Csh2 [Beggiatoa sp. IS2]
MTDIITITNRYEILFLYECKDCNPNGDPLDENRPRTDPETGQATVTDVRIKRTIRDYLLAKNPDVKDRLKNGMEILVRDTLKTDGSLSEGKDRAKQLGNKRKEIRDNALQQCIDARLFGCVLPTGSSKGKDKKSGKGKKSKNEELPLEEMESESASNNNDSEKGTAVQITGPVQFSAFNRSLHRVAPIMVQQTGAFAGGKGVDVKTLAERWLVPYALIASYAVVNEVSARTSQMTQVDFNLLLEALWEGTASLNTHSKMGHDPMLLIVAEYEPMHRLGALSSRIKLDEKTQEDTALRSTADYKVNVSDLLDGFKQCKALKTLKVRQDNRLQLKANDQSADFISLAKQAGLPVVELNFTEQADSPAEK